MSEIGAAQEWGFSFDPTGETPGSWLTLPRQARAVMTAYTSLRRLGAILTGDERQERAKAEAEAERRRKPRS